MGGRLLSEESTGHRSAAVLNDPHDNCGHTYYHVNLHKVDDYLLNLSKSNESIAMKRILSLTLSKPFPIYIVI